MMMIERVCEGWKGSMAFLLGGRAMHGATNAQRKPNVSDEGQTTYRQPARDGWMGRRFDRQPGRTRESLATQPIAHTRKARGQHRTTKL
jgi:hypothetical protein